MKGRDVQSNGECMQVWFLELKLFWKILSLKFLSSASPSPPSPRRELCLVRAHDIKLTKEAEKAQKDLAEAILEAEKNAK